MVRRAALRHPARSGLLVLSVAVGVAAVIVLASLGEGARRYIGDEFASLGTHLVLVLPGRAETAGGIPGMIGGQTPRDLTIADATALRRSSAVREVAPVAVGEALVLHGGRSRQSAIFGTSADLLPLRHWKMAQGRFLAPGDLERAAAECVIGARVQRELFGSEPALGGWLRVGDRRFRVVGVLATEGRSIGIDVQDLVIVPVAAAMQLLNSSSLFRIMVGAPSRESMERAKRDVEAILVARHQGERDVTVITQDAVLKTFDRILRAVTLAIAGIGGVSLVVAGVLITNVMLVAVSQRTAEIGLLVALGATRGRILGLFLGEAGALALVGALAGLAVGIASNLGLEQALPQLDLTPPRWVRAAGPAVALGTGLLAGAAPARRAAALDPVVALRGS